MKGITGRQRLSVRRDGLLITLDSKKQLAQCKLSVSLSSVFPEADQRVFEPLFQRSDLSEVSDVSRKDFIEWVRKALVETVQGFCQNYPDDTSYAVVYNRLADLLKDRDEKIKAYRG